MKTSHKLSSLLAWIGLTLVVAPQSLAGQGRLNLNKSGVFLKVSCEPGSPFQSIQSAIDAASEGDTIVVEPCIYHELINFQGKSITVRSEDPSNPAVVAKTVIDGEALYTSAVVTFDHQEGSKAVLDGLTIRNGWDGGIECFNSSPSVRNCVIENNGIPAFFLIGRSGIFCSGGSPQFLRCIVRGNSAERGGGIHAFDSAPLIEECFFYGNATSFFAPSEGGGGYFSSSINDLPGPLVRDTVFEGNWSHQGAGVYLDRVSARFDRCIIRKNHAVDKGGGIGAYDSTAEFLNCGIVENTGVFNGGGLYLVNDHSNLRNCTVAFNSTFPNYFTRGGGIFAIGSNQNRLSNCVFWGNEASEGPQIALYCIALHGTVQVDYCDMQGGSGGVASLGGATFLWGPGNLELDPLLLDGIHLKDISPLRNAGDPSFVPSSGETDIDGDPRVQEGRVDMGCDEL